MRSITRPSLILAALLAASCATSPVYDPGTGQVRSSQASSQLKAQGAREFANYKSNKQISTNSAYRNQVNRVVNRLARVVETDGTWEVVVFEDETPNAFALPGNKIGVHTGIFQVTQDDTGMATVISHEMAHVTLNHAQSKVNRATGAVLGGVVLDAVLASQGQSGGSRAAAAAGYGALATTGFLLPNSRSAETEADKLGLIYMARAGYDPRDAVDFWKRFAAYNQKSSGGQMPEFLRTHPLDTTRIRSLESYLPVALKEYQR